MESEIKKILNLENVEVAHLRYKGNKKTYVVWTIIEDEPSSSSDDEITDSEVTVDIDIYSDSNYLEIMRLIKTKMKENDWTWDGDSQEFYEEDTKLYHRTCSFKKGRYING
ncbi:MAG: hypothetical protein BHW09_07980 [Clostridium sp. CAG:245_30_32]|jgi:hypothetical protein|nr:MAG: hypothetical protein BHW09_07980 [Clostridium sp. CAG:245_30_32]